MDDLIETMATALRGFSAGDVVQAVRTVISVDGDRAFCAGGDIRALYDAKRAGSSLTRDLYRHEYRLNREIAAFPTEGLLSHLGAEVRAFTPRDFISVKNLRKMDRLSAMTTASVRMAADDAGLRIDAANRDRIGIVMGTAFGNTEHKVQTARVLFTEGPGMVSPIHVPNTVMNAPAGHASIEMGFRGVNTTVSHKQVQRQSGNFPANRVKGR